LRKSRKLHTPHLGQSRPWERARLTPRRGLMHKENVPLLGVEKWLPEVLNSIRSSLPVVSTNYILYLDALVSRHHKSPPLRTHCSLPALNSARQPARYSTAHSTTRPFPHSSPDSKPLDNGPTCSLYLSPTMIRSTLSSPPTLSATLTLTLRRRFHPHLHFDPRPTRRR